MLYMQQMTPAHEYLEFLLNFVFICKVSVSGNSVMILSVDYCIDHFARKFSPRL
jgi:hypothetical protein